MKLVRIAFALSTRGNSQCIRRAPDDGYTCGRSASNGRPILRTTICSGFAQKYIYSLDTPLSRGSNLSANGPRAFDAAQEAGNLTYTSTFRIICEIFVGDRRAEVQEDSERAFECSPEDSNSARYQRLDCAAGCSADTERADHLGLSTKRPWTKNGSKHIWSGNSRLPVSGNPRRPIGCECGVPDLPELH
jgi:hypothetical protein